MTRIVYSLLIVAVMQLGCRKDGASNSVELQYAQTACSDRWKAGQNSTDEEVRRAVQDFFAKLEIAPSRVTISNGGEVDLCKACFCRTGRLITVTISSEFKDDYASYGFE